MSELPNGWAAATVEELGQLQLGKMLDSSKNSGTPVSYLRNINVRWFRFDLSDLKMVPVSDYERERLSVLDGDLFICEGGEPGRSAVWKSGKNDIVYQKALHRFRTNGTIIPEWLMYRLRLEAESGSLHESFSGTTIKHLTRESLQSYVIPVAPIAEQKRIAKKLDAVLGRVDACRTRLDRVPSLLKRFRQSVLAAATSGQLTDEWRDKKCLPTPSPKTLGEILKVSSGKALTAKNMAEGGRIPVFGGNGVTGYHDAANVNEETLVLGRVGYYCGCVHMTPNEAWVTDNALIVRHDEGISARRFLFYALQAIDLRTNDSSTAQPVISGQKIYSLKLQLPSIPEQHEIVRRVEALFAFADRIEARLAQVRLQLDRLTPAILARAFRGKLVPQDPNDELAIALLARLNLRKSKR